MEHSEMKWWEMEHEKIVENGRYYDEMTENETLCYEVMKNGTGRNETVKMEHNVFQLPLLSPDINKAFLSKTFKNSNKMKHLIKLKLLFTETF